MYLLLTVEWGRSIASETENFLIQNGFRKQFPSQSLTPNHSGQFSPFNIVKSLKHNFRASWLNASSKEAFYSTLKLAFTEEAHLDQVEVYKYRKN